VLQFKGFPSRVRGEREKKTFWIERRNQWWGGLAIARSGGALREVH